MIKTIEIQNIEVVPNDHVSADIVQKTMLDGTVIQENRRKVIYPKGGDLNGMIELEGCDKLRSAINSL